MKHLNTFSTLLLLLGLLINSHAHAAAGADTHGGAIVRLQRNGQFLTFGQTDAFKVEVEAIPELMPEVIHVVNTLKSLAIPEYTREAMLKDLIPTSERKYFRVKKISEDDTIRLLQNFRALNPELPQDAEFTIAAYTDPVTRETYLLPVFETLDAPAQDAILLHEAMWALKGRLGASSFGWETYNLLNYDFVVRIEAAFERMLRCQSKCIGAKYNFYSLLFEIKEYRLSASTSSYIEFDENGLKALQSLKLLAEVEGGLILAQNLRETIFQQLFSDGARSSGYSTKKVEVSPSRQVIFDVFVQNPKSAVMSGFNNKNPMLYFQYEDKNEVLTRGLEVKENFINNFEVWIGKDGQVEIPPTWVLGPESFESHALPMIRKTKACKKSGPSGKGCLAGWIN